MSVVPFIAHVALFGFNFPPKNWAFCDGALLPISQNTALFSLIQTFYGGNGTTTYALPELRGRAPLNRGGTLVQGSSGGQAAVTLTEAEMPAPRPRRPADLGRADDQSARRGASVGGRRLRPVGRDAHARGRGRDPSGSGRRTRTCRPTSR